MSERKYTDEQIVKALECCQSHTITDCRDCPNRASGDNCVNELMRNALDLIKHQKAEIAVLTTAVDNSTKVFLKFHDEYQDQKAEIEKLQEVNADLNESLRLAAEANKDLNAEIERLKAEAEFDASEIKRTRIQRDSARTDAIKEFAERVINLIYSADDINPVTEWQIDNLVAEMTEGE